jgi:hypothetical protein
MGAWVDVPTPIGSAVLSLVRSAQDLARRKVRQADARNEPSDQQRARRVVPGQLA